MQLVGNRFPDCLYLDSLMRSWSCACHGYHELILHCNLWPDVVDWILERFWRRVSWFVFCILESVAQHFCVFRSITNHHFLSFTWKFTKIEIFSIENSLNFSFLSWHLQKREKSRNFTRNFVVSFFILIPKMTNSSELWNHLGGNLMNFHWNRQFFTHDLFHTLAWNMKFSCISFVLELFNFLDNVSHPQNLILGRLVK